MCDPVNKHVKVSWHVKRGVGVRRKQKRPAYKSQWKHVKVYFNQRPLSWKRYLFKSSKRG